MNMMVLQNCFGLRILVFLLFGICSSTLRGQDTGLGSWNILNLRYNLSPSWSVFGEAQVRSLKFYDQFHYHEFKGGVNFKPLPKLTLTLGMGAYDTYKEGGNFVFPKNNSEFRFWPQVTLAQDYGVVSVEHRYRAEMRFTSKGYRNRFRYRLGVTKNFQGKWSKLQLGVFNELFFTDKEPYFERNRLSGVATYKVTKNLGLQVGYLYQFDYKINDETGIDFLQVGLLLEWSRPKSTRVDITPVD